MKIIHKAIIYGLASIGFANTSHFMSSNIGLEVFFFFASIFTGIMSLRHFIVDMEND
jgi:hypothetical protein